MYMYYMFSNVMKIVPSTYSSISLSDAVCRLNQTFLLRLPPGKDQFQAWLDKLHSNLERIKRAEVCTIE